MVRVRDLEDQTGIIGCRSVLHCESCGLSMSGNRQEYWLEREDHVFRCHDPKCQSRPLVLAVPEIQGFTILKR